MPENLLGIDDSTKSIKLKTQYYERMIPSALFDINVKSRDPFLLQNIRRYYCEQLDQSKKSPKDLHVILGAFHADGFYKRIKSRWSSFPVIISHPIETSQEQINSLTNNRLSKFSDDARNYMFSFIKKIKVPKDYFAYNIVIQNNNIVFALENKAMDYFDNPDQFQKLQNARKETLKELNLTGDDIDYVKCTVDFY
ncbi:MAG: hypothetical protein KDD48_05245 [Bdellovibrionales bacterium]|nr:hypothetical protein [Bdellovibrionales bacterium]